MYLSLVLPSLLMVSGSFATPSKLRERRAAEEVTVLLQNQQDESGSGFTFKNVAKRTTLPVSSALGPFLQVQIEVDPAAPNQGLRCQVLDPNGAPLVGTRGENIDTTFSDADKGPWTFTNPAGISASAIVCDPAFVGLEDPSDLKVSVLLQNQATELGATTDFDDVPAREERPPTASTGPFETVELIVGSLVPDQELRCQLVNAKGKAIPIVRGGNQDTTFSDQDKGPWTFVQEATVKNIICDPAFVAQPMPVSTPRLRGGHRLPL